MRIAVLPVSGGGFVSQLSLLSIHPDVPHTFLCSSGGNISAYIALAADYQPYAIERILNCMDSQMLLKSWWPTPIDFLPSWLAGYSRGSYYNHGYGVEDMFQSIFTKSSIARKEIWTGTTNCELCKCQLFCNRSRNTTQLNINNFTLNEFNTLPLKYLKGNISDIATITLASASIPSLVPPMTFNAVKYCDGGATYASPLTPMSPIFRPYKKLHIDYINSFDVIAANPLLSTTMGTLIKTTTSEMIHSMILQDRSNGIELVRKEVEHLNYFEFCCSEELLKELTIFRKTLRRSFLEMYPIEYYNIDMSNYRPEDAVKILHTDRKQFRCRFWWNGSRTFDEMVNIADCLRNECCNIATV